jgi:hypothetical protein
MAIMANNGGKKYFSPQDPLRLKNMKKRAYGSDTNEGKT